MSFNSILGFCALTILVSLLVFQILDLRKTKSSINGLNTSIRDITTKNRQEIIRQISKLRGQYSDWSLLILADRFSWPKHIVTCLPKLYFSKGGQNMRCLLWKEVLAVVPDTLEIRITKEYCQGEVLEVSMNKEVYLVVNEIAQRLEVARINNPYQSYSSVVGIINQLMNEFELEIKGQSNSELPKALKSKRKIFLEEELDLFISDSKN